MKYEYQTIEKPIENVLVKEKGSKFIGFAYPILSENDYKEKLNEIKELHPKATHHYYSSCFSRENPAAVRRRHSPELSARKPGAKNLHFPASNIKGETP